MSKNKPLSSYELKKLSATLEKLELEALYSTGYNRISGGFAVTTLIDYDDDIVDIELKFGCQSDVDDYVSTEQYVVSRKTFEIID